MGETCALLVGCNSVLAGFLASSEEFPSILAVSSGSDKSKEVSINISGGGGGRFSISSSVSSFVSFLLNSSAGAGGKAFGELEETPSMFEGFASSTGEIRCFRFKGARPI